MDKPIKRTKVFVSREIQGSILRRMVKYWFFYNVALWHALALLDFQRDRVSGIIEGRPAMNLFAFYTEFASQHALLLLLSAAMFPIVLWDMTKLTNQIAGPLVRFGNALCKIAAGERVERIELRKGDLLLEFQQAFNAVIDSDRILFDGAVNRSRSGPENELLTLVNEQDVRGKRA